MPTQWASTVPSAASTLPPGNTCRPPKSPVPGRSTMNTSRCSSRSRINSKVAAVRGILASDTFSVFKRPPHDLRYQYDITVHMHQLTVSSLNEHGEVRSYYEESNREFHGAASARDA